MAIFVFLLLPDDLGLRWMFSDVNLLHKFLTVSSAVGKYIFVLGILPWIHAVDLSSHTINKTFGPN